MHFVEYGEGRPPLVFVHGFACSLEDWRAQLEHFRRSHRVVACDLRGHGKTPGEAPECSIEHYGGDVAALLATLEIAQAVLIGHSMGCRVVLEANRLAPERVAGLVLIDGSRQGVGDGAAAENAARAALAAKGYATFMRAFFEAMFLQESETSRAAVERALELPEEIGAALFPRMARWDAARMEAALDAVKAPVLAIQSTYVNTERKRVPIRRGETTPWLDLVKQKVAAARIEILPGHGHFPQLEAPERVHRLIEGFLPS